MAERKSYKRDMILALLKSVACHPTAEWIYLELKPEIPELSLATVYRNLEQLADKNIIKKIEGENKTTHYDGNPLPHYHLSCTSCSRIYDFPAEFVSLPLSELSESSHFDVTDYDVHFRGICPGCKTI